MDIITIVISIPEMLYLSRSISTAVIVRRKVYMPVMKDQNIHRNRPTDQFCKTGCYFVSRLTLVSVRNDQIYLSAVLKHNYCSDTLLVLP